MIGLILKLDGRLYFMKTFVLLDVEFVFTRNPVGRISHLGALVARSKSVFTFAITRGHRKAV